MLPCRGKNAGINAKTLGSVRLFACEKTAKKHKIKHDDLAQEVLVLSSLQRLVTKATRESLRTKADAKATPEQRRTTST